MLENPAYLPIKLIFNLLSLSRRTAGSTPGALTQGMQARRLYFGELPSLPRLSFWVRLCQSAALLNDDYPLHPTLFVPDWLALPLEMQLAHLVEAWIEVPLNHGLRRIRRNLVHRLLDQEDLGLREFQEIRALQALGLCEEKQLNSRGYAVLSGNFKEATLPAAAAWTFRNPELSIPYPPDWALLWELEAYIDPYAPGHYQITNRTLRNAAQRGELAELIPILEKGIKHTLPPELVELLTTQPRIRLLAGPVLEFTDPQELLQLRQNASMRRDLARVISPHQVLLDPWQAERVLRRLFRRGLLSERDLADYTGIRRNYPINPANTDDLRRAGRNICVSESERAYLLSLILLASGLGESFAAPPGLFARLSTGLKLSLRASAARKANALLEIISPRPVRISEEEPPEVPEQDLIIQIERAIAFAEPIDVLYHVPGRPASENRHLTPILVEQRGSRFYLIAFCHTRRANRTFRLDRLELLSPKIST